MEVGYFGSHVSGADNSTYRNIPLPGPGAIDARRPNPLISGFKAIRWDGWSIYHSGTVKVERRLARGLSVNASYTWSKSIDDASDVGSTFAETNIPQDVRNVRAEKALSSFDHRHRLVFSFSYALPFSDRPGGLSHIGYKLVKGWTVAALGSAQSGAPFTVTIPTDNANIGAGPSQRPNLAGRSERECPAYGGTLVRHFGVLDAVAVYASATRVEILCSATTRSTWTLGCTRTRRLAIGRGFSSGRRFSTFSIGRTLRTFPAGLRLRRRSDAIAAR